MGMNKEFSYFENLVDDNTLSTLRLIHYEPRINRDLEDEVLKYTTMAHTDSSLLTILTTFNFLGLEILTNDGYKFIKPEPNTLIVNIGDIMQKLSSNL